MCGIYDNQHVHVLGKIYINVNISNNTIFNKLKQYRIKKKRNPFEFVQKIKNNNKNY